MKPVGETEFVNGVAAMSASGRYGKARLCAGIVGHADLGVGPGDVTIVTDRRYVGLVLEQLPGIPVIGATINRYDWFSALCGFCSYDTIKLSYSAAIDDPAVKAVLFDIDSPGGSVYGVAELASEIVKARAQKPVVAVANSLAASAAYWIGCSASEFYVTPGGEVGSIGVWQAHFDYSKALEEEGVKTTLVSAGKFKVEGNPYVPLDPEAQAFMQSRVDDYYNAFIQAVAVGRGVSVDDVRNGMGEGRVLGSDAALAQRMVDGIASFDDVLARMQAKVTGNAVRSQPQKSHSRLKQARDALALV